MATPSAVISDNGSEIAPPTNEAGFVALRTARDRTLPAPRLILPSLQVNIRGGALPRPSADGRIYLRIPVSAA